MRYRVIEAPQLSGLVSLVNQAAEDGWQPHGGVAVAVLPGGSAPHFYQAVVKGGPPDAVASAVAAAAEEMGGELIAAPPDAN